MSIIKGVDIVRKQHRPRSYARSDGFFILICCALLITCLPYYQLHARWAELSDSPLEILYNNSSVFVHRDGTLDIEVETRQKALNESGRSHLAHYVMRYSDASSTIEIIEAKTIYQGKEYLVDPEMIEDRPLASSPHGFDQKRQILISFPKMEVGSEIYLKYKEHEHVPPLNGVYSQRFYYGQSGYWRSSSTKIISELPLYTFVNDANKHLSLAKSSDNSLNTLTIELTGPVSRDVAEGSESGVLNDANLLWVSVSSVQNWKELAQHLQEPYAEIKNQDLPDEFKSIVAEAKEINSEVGQINAVTSLLNQKVQYMGDWRTVHGRFFPRDLRVVAESKIGDCKDFASSTAAMLTHLGYEANVSLVMRGTYGESLYEGMPDIANFNHAFVKVVGKSSVYWIDPTNYISMADGTFEDIADKQVLVLDPKNLKLEMSSPIDPSHAAIEVNKNLQILDDKNLIKSKGTLVLRGERATSIAGARLYSSETSIQDMMFYMLSGKYLEDANKITMLLPDLSSRIVRDLSFSFEYKQDNKTIYSNLGAGIDMSANWVDVIINSAPGQVSDIFIGSPRTLIYNTIIEKYVPNVASLNYDCSTIWLDVKRRCTNQDDGKTSIVDHIVIKKAFITSEELKSLEYKNIRRDLILNFQKLALILKN